MSRFLESKRLLVLLIIVGLTVTWPPEEGFSWTQVRVDHTVALWLGVAYVVGQSLVDAAKAWRGGAR